MHPILRSNGANRGIKHKPFLAFKRLGKAVNSCYNYAEVNMKDKKYSLNTEWQQEYPSWPTKQWLDEAREAVVEQKLEFCNFQEAFAVINMIKKS